MPKTMIKTSFKIQMLAGNSFISRPDSDSQKKLTLGNIHMSKIGHFLFTIVSFLFLIKRIISQMQGFEFPALKAKKSCRYIMAQWIFSPFFIKQIFISIMWCTQFSKKYRGDFLSFVLNIGKKQNTVNTYKYIYNQIEGLSID